MMRINNIFKLLLLLTTMTRFGLVLGEEKKDIKYKLDYVTFEGGAADPVKQHQIEAVADSVRAEVIEIHPDIEFQRISGIGGAFNENGGEALLSLPQKKQKDLLSNLFSTKRAGLTYNRTPVGASDFALEAYSYSPKAEDFAMEAFTIERDKKYLLPFIKKALSVNPEMQLQASPWSPPGWMKGSGRMDDNKTCDPADARLRQDPKIYKAYAAYLLKYIKAYADEGVTIKVLCIQNEPDTYQSFPGCNMTIAEMHHLTKDYLRPAFKTAGLKTELWAGTIRAIKGRFDHLELLEQGRIGDFDGIGVQYFSTNYLKELHAFDRSIRLIHTEGVCFGGQNSRGQAKSRMPEIASYINSGCENYCYWNMILNEESKSAWGWKQNCLVTVNRSTGEVVYNPDYNVLYLVGQTLQPGDVRIAHAADRSIMRSIITVKSLDGTIKVLLQNNNCRPRVCLLRIMGREKRVRLPAESLCRITLK